MTSMQRQTEKMRQSAEMQREMRRIQQEHRRRLPLSSIWERTRTGDRPTVAGWYRDPETGGTKFWDGSRWSGDTRPRRRPFAAAADQRAMGIGVIVCFGLLNLIIFAGGLSDGSMTWSQFPWVFLAALIGCAFGAYLIRGQGPTTASVWLRLDARKEAAEKAEQQLADLGRRSRATSSDAAAAARVKAMADPKTAEALQNLQNLLYTGALTDAEFQIAKDNLLGATAATNLAKLAELHQAGILSDFEFAAAKAKALGLA